MFKTTRGSVIGTGRRGRVFGLFDVEGLESRQVLSTYVVDSLLDNSGGGDFQNLTLRQAIELSNASTDPSANQINFKLGSGPQKILLSTPLPAITHPVVIDGLTQPGSNGAPAIELTPRRGFTGDGLTVYAGNSTVRGLILSGFNGNALVIGRNGGDLVENNIIGFDGTVGADNNGNGILIKAVPNNVIQNNVISGNQNGAGVLVSNDGVTPPITTKTQTTTSDPVSGTGTVLGSKPSTKYGTDINGSFSISNSNPNFSFKLTDGSIQASTASNTDPSAPVTGTATFPAAGTLTVSSGNYTATSNSTTATLSNGTLLNQILTAPITIDAAFSGPNIIGNYSLNATLTASKLTPGGAPPAQVVIQGTISSVITTTTTETSVPVPNNPTGNVIQNNFVGTDRTTNANVGNMIGVEVDGNASANNVVKSNTFRFNKSDSVLLQKGSAGTQVGSNLISMNAGNGIHLLNSGTNNIFNNTIESSEADGIQISGGAGNLVTANTVVNNPTNGIELSQSSGNTLNRNSIGSTVDTGLFLNNAFGNYVEGNQISRCTGAGIRVYSDPAVVPNTNSPNMISSNTIGTDGTGSNLGNFIGVELQGSGTGQSYLRSNVIRFSASDGIFIHDGASNNHVEAGNVISNSVSVGIQIFGGNGNVISGDNVTANRLDGIFINGGSRNIVIGNTISYNNGVGVQIFGPASGNTVQSNTIAGSGTDGIFVNSAGGNAVISNTITNNTNVGVHIFGTSGSAQANSNTVFGNMIRGNLDGIALAGWANSNQIGSDAVSTGGLPGNSVIANRRSGINIVGSHANNNTIQGNLLRSNNGFDLVLQSAASGNIVGGRGGEANAIGTPLALYTGARSKNTIGRNTFATPTRVPSPKGPLRPRAKSHGSLHA